jgi:hypothetical protein
MPVRARPMAQLSKVVGAFEPSAGRDQRNAASGSRNDRRGADAGIPIHGLSLRPLGDQQTRGKRLCAWAVQRSAYIGRTNETGLRHSSGLISHLLAAWHPQVPLCPSAHSEKRPIPQEWLRRAWSRHLPRQSFGTARRTPPRAGSHLGSPLNPGRPVLTWGVSRRSGSVAYVRADASPNEVLRLRVDARPDHTVNQSSGLPTALCRTGCPRSSSLHRSQRH